jgi:Adenylate cyclase, family 3 (some proteins contain HAMP domain)
MRFLPNIRYGTEDYAEKVARRLRAFNIAVWAAAVVPASMALVRYFDGKWKHAIADAVAAAAYASMPLLHRFGPLVGPLTFAGLSYAVIFWVSFLVGTNGGERLGYFVATSLSILIIGTEHYLISGVVGVASIGLIILTEVVLPRDSGFVSPTFLFFTNFVVGVVSGSVLLYGIIFYAVRQMERAEDTAEREHRRSEGLLVNILPPSVAARLKDRPESEIADAYPEASILFADMAGFTARASDTTPEELVHFLNGVYTKIDSLVERHGLEKIKTTGDAYMVVSGVPQAVPDHAGALADLALDMRDALAGLIDPKGRPVPVRIGIASGPVVAGVVGTRKFFYDVWGDAVNTASRMESTGESGKIQVAPATRELLADRFELVERGVIDVRGKGPMQTWFLIRRTPEESKPGAT